MRARTVVTAALCSLGLALSGCSTEVAGSPQLPASAGDHVAGGSQSGQAGGSGAPEGAPGGSGGDSGGGSGNGSTGAPALPTDLGDLQSLLGQAPGSDDGPDGSGDGPGTDSAGAPALPTDLGDLQSLLGQAPGTGGAPALPTDLGELGLGGACMTLAGFALGTSLLLLGPSMGGTPLTKSAVDDAFASLDDPPEEIRPTVDKLHQLIQSAVGQPPEKVQQILGSEEYGDATDKLSAYMESQCGGA